jgi:hypothetical protein
MRMRFGNGFVIAVLWLAWGCFGSHPMGQSADPADPVSTGPAPAGGAGSSAPQSDFHNASWRPDPTPVQPPLGTKTIGPGVMIPPAPNARIVSEFLSDAQDEWITLLEVDWELDARQEQHLCARARVPRGMYLHEFVSLSPLGTHHTQLSVYDSAGSPGGVTACGPDGGGHHVFGSGVGSEPFTLPDGIAMRIEEGQELNLNLHLFNTGSEPLSGRSGVRVRTMAEAEVEHVAEIVLGGPLGLSIPPGRVTQTGQCTFSGDATIFNLAPHMHQLGVHLRAVAQTQSGEIVLYDGDYAFESQQRHPVDFVPMRGGAVVRVECTYENDTDGTVGWGQSSRDEMCFASMMRFPPLGGYVCTN